MSKSFINANAQEKGVEVLKVDVDFSETFTSKNLNSDIYYRGQSMTVDT
jgi:hypothetical protein